MAVKTILYLDHTAKLGGGEIALLNLLRSLDRDRYRPVVVLASDGPLASRLRAAGVETHVFPLDTAVVETRKDNLGVLSLLRLRRVFALLRYAGRLAGLIRRWNIDLIHANSLKADIYGGIAGRLARVPVLWHVRDHIDGQYLPPAVAALFRWLAGWAPSMIVANSESTLQRLQVSSDRRTAVVYSGVREIGSRGGPEGRMQVVHDGTFAIPPHDSPPGAVGEASGGPPVVTLVGRIAPWKGQRVFLAAAAAVLSRRPDVRFRIVGAPLFGEEDYERSLHDLTDSPGLGDQVEFLGFRDDVAELLAQTDVVVHASTMGEPFGQVVIEGMAAGKPVVATDGGALPEIVENGVTGLLVPMGDSAAMAEAIFSLLEDPARARSMGEAGCRRVLARFTIERTARKVEAIYDALLTDGSRHGGGKS